MSGICQVYPCYQQMCLYCPTNYDTIGYMQKEPKAIKVSGRIKPSVYQKIIKKKKKDSFNKAMEDAFELYVNCK